MTTRPIIFSGEMVRAILDGRKTQTRRLVTNATSQGNWKASQLDLSTAWVDPGPSPIGNPGPYLKANMRKDILIARGFGDDEIVDRLYPRWFVGDRLWVRETFRAGDKANPLETVHYRADIDEPEAKGQWQSSRFMPRWASRITLGVTKVRCERLQDISLDDCEAEGVKFPPAGRSVGNFANLWDSLNATRAPWASNPWVFVLEFRRV